MSRRSFLLLRMALLIGDWLLLGRGIEQMLQVFVVLVNLQRVLLLVFERAHFLV